MEQIQQLINGLLYLSESEAAFDVHQWPDVHREQEAISKIASTHQISESSVEIGNARDLFYKLIEEQDMEDEFVKEQSQRYKTLQQHLAENYELIGLFKTPAPVRDMYIICLQPGKPTLALHTQSVET